MWTKIYFYILCHWFLIFHKLVFQIKAVFFTWKRMAAAAPVNWSKRHGLTLLAIFLNRPFMMQKKRCYDRLIVCKSDSNLIKTSSSPRDYSSKLSTHAQHLRWQWCLRCTFWGVLARTGFTQVWDYANGLRWSSCHFNGKAKFWWKAASTVHHANISKAE